MELLEKARESEDKETMIDVDDEDVSLAFHRRHRDPQRRHNSTAIAFDAVAGSF